MSIFYSIYGSLKAQLDHAPKMLNNVKLARKTFNTLDTETISDIILDGHTFWFEYPKNGAPVPDDVHDYLVAYLTQRYNYKYLYA